MGAVYRLPGANPADAAVGARLRHWRERRGLGLAAMAQVLGLSPEEMRRIEAGRARLDSATLGAATRVLGLPLWALQADRPTH